MNVNIAGTWKLKVWRRVGADGNDIFPLGECPVGILIYTDDGNMAVQMLTAERARLHTDDPVGGTLEERAAAYSSCLAYFGTYEVVGDAVYHHVEAALYPNWSNTNQKRPYVMNGDELSLRVFTEDGRLSNEIVWTRKGGGS